MTLISFSYTMRSGKDCSCDYLVKQYGFKKIAFATSLKEACGSIFGLTDEQMHGKLKEVVDGYWGMTPRHILQQFGTETMREHFDKDIWVKSVFKRISLEPETNWCISDCRFLNEVEFVKQQGGIAIKLVRNTGLPPSTHISETQLNSYSGWDYVIDNNGSVEDLHRILDSIMGQIKREEE